MSSAFPKNFPRLCPVSEIKYSRMILYYTRHVELYSARENGGGQWWVEEKGYLFIPLASCSSLK